MADIKFEEQKRVKLLRGIVYQGGVYAKGSVLSVETSYAEKLIADGDAEAEGKPAPAPRREVKEKGE